MSDSNPHKLQFTLHPRVFAALGSDLVTNDVVAILELVKNSYDAGARAVSVDIRNMDGSLQIRITDDGCGMGYETIRDVWCVVATPYKNLLKLAGVDPNMRVASGDKGLGRLSAARLGTKLELTTRASNKPVYRVNVDWDVLNSASTIADCSVEIATVSDDSISTPTGTTIVIRGLRSIWPEEQVEDLRVGLSRLLSPFKRAQKMSIHLGLGSEASEALELKPEPFLEHPKYSLVGQVSADGDILAEYNYRKNVAKAHLPDRNATVSIRWDQVKKSQEAQGKGSSLAALKKPTCGPFEFELRVWDVDKESIHELELGFKLQSSQARNAIKAYRGVSVYRDDVLVLPKSDASSDWLGLDLRRVSKTGSRLSTSQVLGYVQITDRGNPGIKDTSDRESLVESHDVEQFRALLLASLGALENERARDRAPKAPEPESTNDLFDRLSTAGLRNEINRLEEDGGTLDDAVDIVSKFAATYDQSLKELQQRFVYYSRLATIGTISQMLIHEIRNRTTVLGAYIRSSEPYIKDATDSTKKLHDGSLSSIQSLERLADTFAPLASRAFGNRRRSASFMDRANGVLTLNSGEIRASKVTAWVSPTVDAVLAVDPGELDAILLNLVINALYWLLETDPDKRKLNIEIETDQTTERARVSVHDSGPGVEASDLDRIMLPGVTKRPGGIGMGLTVVAELVASYGGKLGVTSPGKLGGTTFGFDLPLKRSEVEA